jgi:hypothetical protein
MRPHTLALVLQLIEGSGYGLQLRWVCQTEDASLSDVHLNQLFACYFFLCHFLKLY